MASPIISKLRSTNCVVRRSWMNESNVASAVSSAMNAAAMRMSCSSPFTSRCIKWLPALVDARDEMRLSHRVGHNEIDGVSEQSFEALLELVVALLPWTVFVVLRVIYSKVTL